jgi:putative ABC transport system permease protein
VKAVGSIGFSNAAIIFDRREAPLKTSLIGVEPGQPGEPPALEGQGLAGSREKEAIIDRNVALRTGLKVGDDFWLKSLQGGEEEYYALTVIGISDGRQYFLQPSIFVPYLTWDEIKPKAMPGGGVANFNIMAVQLDDPALRDLMAGRIEAQVGGVEAVDRVTAYEATPGYSAQQSTLNTQRVFTLLIGVLVVGGFFQIQTLQKVAQIGMLKAIGASNWTIALAFLVQIVMITVLGVTLGGLGTLALSLGFPPTVPIVFTNASVLTATASLLVIGPLGGLVSLRILLQVEPLTALGLAS